MSYDYSSLATTGASLITKFGRNVTLKHVTEGSYNFSTGAVTGDSVSSETVKAVFTNFNDGQIDGSIIQRGDRLVFVSKDVTSKPKMNDVIGGFKIVGVETIQPANDVLLYKLQVRK